MNTIVNIKIPHNRFLCHDNVRPDIFYLLPQTLWSTVIKLGSPIKQSKRFSTTARKYSTNILEYITQLFNDDPLSQTIKDAEGFELYSTESFNDGKWFGIDEDGIFIADIIETE
ncbi:hypothetical protein [Enterovibrio nigricans]|uniref:Uncharacterized protein n=1 Tax=Enterovibrio nigricans DSM 22720 TaxID=1121868 RepID=A0A1T4V5M3_9GAMM|nr:hypothetical protein [Enterovibrio nigricans]PKF49876.1 hypothetical protein AT251_15615 [Enterovibrio nigricans]SKA60280.1 hypothetical protein SAMN02745132_03267 [Enterovibrio nigricans DSM 22720]